MVKKEKKEPLFNPTEILYPKDAPTLHLGKNGSWLCCGLRFTYEGEVKPTSKNKRHWPEAVRIQPITSKGEPGKCFIEIPVSELRAARQAIGQIIKEAGKKANGA